MEVLCGGPKMLSCSRQLMMPCKTPMFLPFMVVVSNAAQVLLSREKAYANRGWMGPSVSISGNHASHLNGQERGSQKY